MPMRLLEWTASSYPVHCFANCKELSKCAAVSLETGLQVSRLGKGRDCDIPRKAGVPGNPAWLREGPTQNSLPVLSTDRLHGDLSFLHSLELVSIRKEVTVSSFPWGSCEPEGQRS